MKENSLGWREGELSYINPRAWTRGLLPRHWRSAAPAEPVRRRRREAVCQANPVGSQDAVGSGSWDKANYSKRKLSYLAFRNTHAVDARVPFLNEQGLAHASHSNGRRLVPDLLSVPTGNEISGVGAIDAEICVKVTLSWLRCWAGNESE